MLSKVNPGDFSTLPDVFGVKELAIFRGCSPKKIYEQVRKKGGIPHRREGREIVFGKGSIGKYYGIL